MNDLLLITGTVGDAVGAVLLLLLAIGAMLYAYREWRLPEPPDLVPSAEPQTIRETGYVEITDAYHQYWVVHLADIVAISSYKAPATIAHPDGRSETTRLSFIHIGQGTGIRIETTEDEAKAVRQAWEEWSGFDNMTVEP